MRFTSPICIDCHAFDINTIMRDYPPVWRHPLKQAVYDKVVSHSAPFQGSLRYTRWELSELPETMGHRCDLVVDPDVYAYVGGDAFCWHVNFADPQLFVAYGSPLLAQDELQVLEHPALGALRETLVAKGIPAVTRSEGRNTPVLIAGVPRQCALDVFPTPDFPGLEHGLYGNRFQVAGEAAVFSALSIISPPTTTNLIAIAAPTGSGHYTQAQITTALQTAFTGMLAAQIESARFSPSVAVEVHTGYWGCGAFGGNRVLMAMLQIIAARLACIDRLVFHTGSHSDVFPFDEARVLLNRLSSTADGNVLRLLQFIYQMAFKWGASDCN